MSGRRGRPLNDDERVLWTAFTKAIEPLSKQPKFSESEIATSPPIAPAAGKTGKATGKTILKPIGRPASAFDSVTPKQPKPPSLEPLGRREKKRVASGRSAIDGWLDLHGLTQAEAHDALARFIEGAVTRDARLVLVITGKGRGGGEGILRRQVPLWLQLPDLREYVIGFEPAHVTHGGDGALYVRIRRRRVTE